MTHGQKIPSFARVIITGGVILLVLMVLGAFKIQDVIHDRQQESCERVVQAREDNRTMWTYLLAGEDVDHDDPKVVAFTVELNKRLPPLECVNRIAVPVGDK